MNALKCLVGIVIIVAVYHVSYAEEEAGPRTERFGFADTLGHHILLQVEPSFETQLLTRAICAQGRSLPVTAVSMADIPHTHPTDERAEDKDFHSLGGTVYHVGEPGTAPHDTCYLVDQKSIDESDVLVPGQTDEPCPEALNNQLEADLRRVVAKCSVLAMFESGLRIALVEYQPEGKHLLASLTLFGDDRLANFLMPAKSGTGSAWRVDDEEEISAEDFEVLFGLNGPEGAAVAIAWAGAEGSNIGLYQVQGDTLEIVAEGYRYFQFPDAQ